MCQKAGRDMGEGRVRRTEDKRVTRSMIENVMQEQMSCLWMEELVAIADSERVAGEGKGLWLMVTRVMTAGVSSYGEAVITFSSY